MRLSLLLLALAITALPLIAIAAAQETNTTNTTSLDNITVTIPSINVTSKAAIQLNAYIDKDGVAHFIYVCEYMASPDECAPLKITLKNTDLGIIVSSLSIGVGTCGAGICRDVREVPVNGDSFTVEVTIGNTTYTFNLRRTMGAQIESNFSLASLIMSVLPFAIVAAFAIRGTIMEAGAGMVAGGVFAILSRYIGADPATSMIEGVIMMVLGLLILALLK